MHLIVSNNYRKQFSTSFANCVLENHCYGLFSDVFLYCIMFTPIFFSILAFIIGIYFVNRRGPAITATVERRSFNRRKFLTINLIYRFSHDLGQTLERIDISVGNSQQVLVALAQPIYNIPKEIQNEMSSIEIRKS